MKFRKWLTGFGIALLLLTIGGVFFLRYMVVDRFKDIIQILVSRETGDKYIFDASKVNVSFFSKKIIVHDAVLKCRDTINAPYYYNAGLKELYLSIGSWREIILNQTLTIDSLAIQQPSFFSYDKDTARKKQHVSFHLSNLINNIDKALAHLKLNSLSVNGANIELHNTHSLSSFHGHGINLHIKNFLRRKDSTKHFLFSDDVDLMINRQTLKLPDGMHELSFGRLHFSGKNQFFELDSISIHSTPVNPHQLKISSSKVYFSSSDLTSVYEKEEIGLDTLLVVNPEVIIEKKEKVLDTTQAVSETTKSLLAGLRFKYIGIEGGSINIIRPDGLEPAYSTKLKGAKLYDLTLDKNTKKITAGKIELEQKDISFVTRDSLYELNVGEFSFINNELNLKNAVYKPTALNKLNKGLTFRTPLLRLTDISIEDLLLKRLKSRSARLFAPEIILLSSPLAKSKDTSGLSKSDLFYKTLKNLHAIIKVDSFRITDGDVHVRSVNGPDMHIRMNSLNTLILLNNFFSSDSLIEIKRSMPELTVKGILFKNNKLAVELRDYDFNGTVRRNHAGKVSVQLKNNTTIEGDKLSWEILDWDLLEKYKIIQIDHARIQSLKVNINNPHKRTEKTVQKDLPVIRIGRIDIDNVYFNNNKPGTTVKFSGGNICIDDIRSVEHYLVWGAFEADIRGLDINKGNTSISVGGGMINNYYRHILQNIIVKLPGSQLSAPSMVVRAGIQTTDFTKLNISSIAVEKAKLGHSQHKPGKDSLYLHSSIDLNVENISRSSRGFTIGKGNIRLKDANLSSGRTVASLPQFNLRINKATALKDVHNKMVLRGAIAAKLTGMKMQLTQPDSSVMTMENIDAGFDDPSFSSNDKLRPATLLKHAYINQGKFEYAGKKLTATVGSINWNSKKNTLQLGNFSVTPNESMEDMFRRAGEQVDYLKVSGKSVLLKDINIKHTAKDSGFTVGKVLLDGVSLHTTKDKRLPFIKRKEKLMPTEMIRNIKWPVDIDTVQLRNSNVTVNEISATTHKKGTIPLEDINADILNISNNKEENDSIYLSAQLKLFNNYVKEFNYAESYRDSLSAFRVSLKTSPMKLEEYTPITRPLASASIDRGSADFMSANWSGNKHAAVGEMNFHYDHLKVRLLNKKNPDKKGFILGLENMLANSLIRNKNNKSSTIFFVRNKNRSIFNYWVKTKLSGVVSTLVKMKDKSNKKKYKKLKDQYQL